VRQWRALNKSLFPDKNKEVSDEINSKPGGAIFRYGVSPPSNLENEMTGQIPPFRPAQKSARYTPAVHASREVALMSDLKKAAQEVMTLEAAGRAVIALVQAVHKAKGRYHSQIAMCDLYDACGLDNMRPTK
jgi:hypothetical protein